MRRVLGLVAVLIVASWVAGAVTARAQELAAADRAPRFYLASAHSPTLRDAGNAPMLRRRIAVSLERVPVGAALETIAAQANLRLLYSRDLLPTGSRVSLRADDITVTAALTEVLLDTGLDVVLSPSGQMTLVKRVPREVPAPMGAVVGRVTDKKTGISLAGATVVVDGTSHSATTGNDGRYRIAAVAPGTYTLRARYIGYAPGTASITVSADQEATADFTLEKSAQRLDEVVTTGTVVPTEVKALPTPISVVTSEEIQGQNIQRIDQLFRGAIPGALAWEQGADNRFSTINVRGASSFYLPGAIKTYLDGIELTNPTFIATLDPNSIDRVELVRGPEASTIYGSEALTGVMQIFTKKGGITRQPEINAKASAGAVQTQWLPGRDAAFQQDYGISVGGGTSEASYNVGGSYQRTGAWIPEYSNSGKSLYASARATQGRLSADLTARYYDLGQSTALQPVLAAYTPPEQQNFTYTLQQRTIGLTLRYQAGQHWQHALTLGYDRDLQEFARDPQRVSSADTLFSTYDDDFAKSSIRYNTSIDTRLSRVFSSTVTAGVDYYRYGGSTVQLTAPQKAGTLAGANLSYAARSDYKNVGYYAQWTAGMSDALFITTGLRAENNDNLGSQYGLAWAPRAGIAYVRNVGGVTLKARVAYGKALRPPLPAAASGEQSAVTKIIPNPALGPEQQRGWDGGLELYFGRRASIEATYYNQTAVDLIDLVLLDAATTPIEQQFQNVGQIKNRGLELLGTFHFTDAVSLTGTFSRTNSLVQALSPTYGGELQIGDQILGIPRNAAGATITFASTRGAASLSMTYVGAQTNYDYTALFGFFFAGQPFRGSLRDYWTAYPAFAKLALALSRDIRPNLTAFLDVKNLTNSYSYERDNHSAPPGRQTNVGLRARF